MELDPKVEQLRKTLHGYLADYNENFNPGPDESRQTGKLTKSLLFIFLLNEILVSEIRPKLMRDACKEKCT